MPYGFRCFLFGIAALLLSEISPLAADDFDIENWSPVSTAKFEGSPETLQQLRARIEANLGGRSF